jgi:hypothetical protein
MTTAENEADDVLRSRLDKARAVKALVCEAPEHGEWHREYQDTISALELEIGRRQGLVA